MISSDAYRGLYGSILQYTKAKTFVLESWAKISCMNSVTCWEAIHFDWFGWRKKNGMAYPYRHFGDPATITGTNWYGKRNWTAMLRGGSREEEVWNTQTCLNEGLKDGFTSQKWLGKLPAWKQPDLTAWRCLGKIQAELSQKPQVISAHKVGLINLLIWVRRKQRNTCTNTGHSVPYSPSPQVHSANWEYVCFFMYPCYYQWHRWLPL